MMILATTPTPRERLLTTILALCRVKAVGQLSFNERRLVRDALAVVDELTAAAGPDENPHASSPAPSDSDGSDTASDTASSASERSPSPRGGFQSRLRQPTPARQFAARRQVPGAQKPVKAANPANAAKKTTAPLKPSKLRAPKWIPRKDPGAVAQPEPSAPATGTSKLRQPAIVVRPRAPSAHEAPQSHPSFPLDPASAFDASLLKCVCLQDLAEYDIGTAVEQLGQLLEWHARVADSALFVEVAPVEAEEPLRVSGQDILLALLEVECSIETIVELSQQSSLKVSQVWIGSPWLRARQRSIAQHAAQVFQWIQQLRMVMDGCQATTLVTASFSETTPPVWRASLQPQPCSDTDKTISDKRIVSPPKASLIRAEYAVGAFIAQLIGACAPSASENLLMMSSPEDDAVNIQHELMDALCAADEALDVIQTRCLRAAEDLCGTQELKTWQEALDDAYALAAHALGVGQIDCSRRICSLKDCNLAIMKIRATEDEFPTEDGGFTANYYYELEQHIAAVHVAIRCANKKPADAKFQSAAQDVLTSIVDELAVWADPRFDSETDVRPHERAAYRELIVWCTKVLGETL